MNNIYLQDIKKHIYKKSPSYTDNINLIMNFYSDKNSVELERSDIATTIYKNLNWNKYNQFDVINSFYITFVCALVATQPDNFRFGKKTKLAYRTTFGFCDISKINFAKKSIDEDYKELHNNLRKFYKTDIGSLCNRLAGYCHSIANFMPSPSAYEKGKLSYNQLKGCLPDCVDYLPLFIDKIQYCYENNLPLHYNSISGDMQINYCTIAQWHDWFIKNYDTTLHLEDYYTIRGNQIIGNNFFLGQSLSYPIPKTKKEINECLSSMIQCIESRANSLPKKPLIL